MHIAVCFDDVADRKQLERLLDRESDKRKEKTGVFYTDSYGQTKKLFPKRMSYDIIFIGIYGIENDIDYALSLAKSGVTAPIIICSEVDGYDDQSTTSLPFPKNILFLKKPVLRADLSAILDQAEEIKAHEEKTIEIRHNTDTYYVFEDDIEFIKTSGRYIVVHLNDQTEVSVLDNILNFYNGLYSFEHLVLASPKLIINASHVAKCSAFKVKLKNGLSIRVPLSGSAYIKKAMKNIEEKRKSNDN